MGVASSKKIWRGRKDPPTNALLTEYTRCTLCLLHEAADIWAEVHEFSPVLTCAEFDEVFGVILGDAEDHFKIWSTKGTVEGNCDAYAVFAALCWSMRDETANTIRRVHFTYDLFTNLSTKPGFTAEDVTDVMMTTCVGIGTLSGRLVDREVIKEFASTIACKSFEGDSPTGRKRRSSGEKNSSKDGSAAVSQKEKDESGVIIGKKSVYEWFQSHPGLIKFLLQENERMESNMRPDFNISADYAKSALFDDDDDEESKQQARKMKKLRGRNESSDDRLWETTVSALANPLWWAKKCEIPESCPHVSIVLKELYHHDTVVGYVTTGDVGKYDYRRQQGKAKETSAQENEQKEDDDDKGGRKGLTIESTGPIVTPPVSVDNFLCLVTLRDVFLAFVPPVEIEYAPDELLKSIQTWLRADACTVWEKKIPLNPSNEEWWDAALSPGSNKNMIMSTGGILQDQPLFNMLEAFCQSPRRHIPVIEGIGTSPRPVGCISRKRMLQFVVEDLSVLWNAANMTLGDLDIFGDKLVSVGQEETAMGALVAMRDHNVDVVFIVDDSGIPIDALSIDDFLEPLMMEPPSVERLNVAEILCEIERETFSLAKHFSADVNQDLIEEVGEATMGTELKNAEVVDGRGHEDTNHTGDNNSNAKGTAKSGKERAGKAGKLEKLAKAGKGEKSVKDRGSGISGAVTTVVPAAAASGTLANAETKAMTAMINDSGGGEQKSRRKTFGEAGWYLPCNHVRGFAPSASKEDLERGLANYFASFYQRAVDFGPPRKAPRRAMTLDSLTKTFEKVLSSRVSALPLFNAAQTEVLGCITPSLLLAITQSWNDYDCVRVASEGKGRMPV